MAAAGEEIPVGRRQRKSSVISFRPFPFVGHRLASIFFLGGGFHRFRDRFLGRSCRNRSRLQRCRMSADRRLPLVQQQLMKIILEENEIFGQKKKIRKMDFFFRRLFSNSFPASRFVSRARRFFGLFSFFFLLIFLVFFFAYGSREWQ